MTIKKIIFNKHFVLIFILSLVASAGLTYTSYMNAPAIQALVSKDIKSFIRFIIIMISIFIIANILSFLRVLIREKYTQKLAEELRNSAINSFKISYIKSEHKADDAKYLNMVVSDVQYFEQYLNESFKVIYLALKFFMAVVALIVVHIYIFIFSILLSVLMFMMPAFFQKRISVDTDSVSKSTEDFNKNISNHLISAESLKNNNAFSLLSNIVKIGSKQISKAKIARTKSSSKLATVNTIFNMFNQLLIIAFAGYLAYIDEISFGAIFAASALVGEFFSSAVQVIELYPNFISLKTILKKYQANKEVTENLEDKIPLEKQISVKNLTYKYNNNIISYPDFNIEKNKKYIIVGSSGSGKSTLLNILNGNLRGYEGYITWDDKSYRDLSFNQLKNSISSMNQEVQILNGSIKYNIILNKVYNDALFKEVLIKSKLIDVVYDLTEKEDTLLDSTNPILSGGQLQRVSLARALYHNTQVFFIDEGTSSLDAKTSAEIEELLFNDKNLTVIMVTHHLNDKLKDFTDKIINL